jgi:hypothetical protein
MDRMRQKRVLLRLEAGEDLLVYQNAEVTGILMLYFPHLRNAALSPSADRFVNIYTPPWDDPSETLWFRLRRVIMFILGREHCANPGCRRTAIDGAHLSYCGGCGTIRYCSSGCQKASWRHNAAPHRSVCARYPELMRMHGLDPYGGEDAAGVLGRMRKPPVLFRTLLASAEMVVDHEQARTKWEMSFAPGCESPMRSAPCARLYL